MIYQFFLGRSSLVNSLSTYGNIDIKFKTDNPSYCFDYFDAYYIFCQESIDLNFVDKSPFFRFSMEEV